MRTLPTGVPNDAWPGPYDITLVDHPGYSDGKNGIGVGSAHGPGDCAHLQELLRCLSR